MRHHSNIRTLSRTRRGRTALIRGLAIALINEGKIVTTTAKAKELRPFVESLVTFGKKGTIAGRRIVATRLGEPASAIVQKLFGEVAEKYKDREGGYTRITKVGRSDAGRDESVIEFV